MIKEKNKDKIELELTREDKIKIKIVDQLLPFFTNYSTDELKNSICGGTFNKIFDRLLNKYYLNKDE